MSNNFISVNVKGVPKLAKLAERLQLFYVRLLGICADELYEFMKILKADPQIPQDYKDLLFVAFAPAEDVVAIAIEVPERFKYERFGNRKEWAIYHCPRRGYAGGHVVKEWDGPSFIKMKWETYKNIFMHKVKSRLGELKQG